MVREQLEERGIVDQRVLDAMARVPREAFVDERDRSRAYFDMPLRIGWGQTISQPYMVALICQTADVKEGDTVLDIGTGSGYQAAVLAAMGADVHSVERIPELADKARAGWPPPVTSRCTCTSATARSGFRARGRSTRSSSPPRRRRFR